MMKKKVAEKATGPMGESMMGSSIMGGLPMGMTAEEMMVSPPTGAKPDPQMQRDMGQMKMMGDQHQGRSK